MSSFCGPQIGSTFRYEKSSPRNAPNSSFDHDRPFALREHDRYRGFVQIHEERLLARGHHEFEQVAAPLANQGCLDVDNNQFLDKLSGDSRSPFGVQKMDPKLVPPFVIMKGGPKIGSRKWTPFWDREFAQFWDREGHKLRSNDTQKGVQNEDYAASPWNVVLPMGRAPPLVISHACRRNQLASAWPTICRRTRLWS